ncbi:hypothetical protein CBR_g9158 [Chara braunii]|uniref:Arp2/3 complex 34 kDa subunit n=1 Tax=Chara braunii TaxID=69332 RepID=A0A388KNV9_CHABU|nr:hypothetical protein CBR_g9158 [Chara braunii]|eukprot:GBG71750.1 hypothetical protein CBR_g9158 [Chara braunii]
MVAILEQISFGVNSLEKALEIDVHLLEFNDIRYRLQASVKDPRYMRLSIKIPAASPQVPMEDSLPLGAIEAVEEAYGTLVEVQKVPEAGYDLTLKVDLHQLPPTEEERFKLMTKLAALRAIIMGAPLRETLKSLLSQPMAEMGETEGGGLQTAYEKKKNIVILHRPGEFFYAFPQSEKVTIVFPMRFKDSNDAALGVAFLQEFMEARRGSASSCAPPCSYSRTPPQELEDAPPLEKQPNAGFVSFIIFRRHVDGERLEKTTWAISTFHAYVSYHVKCSKAFMHTRMRTRVESLIQDK